MKGIEGRSCCPLLDCFGDEQVDGDGVFVDDGDVFGSSCYSVVHGYHGYFVVVADDKLIRLGWMMSLSEVSWFVSGTVAPVVGNGFGSGKLELEEFGVELEPALVLLLVYGMMERIKSLNCFVETVHCIG